MSQITINLNGQDIVFGEWDKDSYRWAMTPNGIDDEAAIYVASSLTSKRMFVVGFMWGSGKNAELVASIGGIYDLFYHDNYPEFPNNQIQVVKDHIDGFLKRVNTMKSFI